MRAVLYDAFQAMPEVVSVPDPVCPADGVIVAVVATGLCRSDWHGWMGHDPDVVLPHVPGHEFAGKITAVGSGVSSWRVGDRVTSSFVGACGGCATCRRGEPQVCDRQRQPGFMYWGSFAELVAVRYAEHNLVAVPAALSMDVAAILGCRFGTAYRAVVHRGQLRSGEWLVVHGCGGVGLSAVMIAASRGAQVIAVDVSDAALARAGRLGAAVLLHADREDVPAAVHEITRGGAQLSVDAYGATTTAATSIASLGKRGRHVQIGLLAEHGGQVPVPMARVLSDELDILGSHGMPARDYPDLLAEIETGALDPGILIEQHIGLGDAAAALSNVNTAASPGITIIEPTRR
jgi:alcohol dehydrogenase